MSSLDDFRNLDFMEQIALLEEIQAKADGAAIAQLSDLFVTPVGDRAVDTMLRKVLRELLLRHPAVLLNGLAAQSRDLARFCAVLAGEARLAEATAPLMELARTWREDQEALHDCLIALGRIGDPAAVPLFRECLDQEDDFIVCACITNLGVLGDQACQAHLEAVVDANEAPESSVECLATTWAAIDALFALGTDPALTYLTSKIHHGNPTARRLILQGLVGKAEQALPFLRALLGRTEDTDEKILLANALGFIGSRQSANDVIDALESGRLGTVNERFAGYEALGRIPGMKSIVFLQSALWKETDSLLLLAIARGLDALSVEVVAEGAAREVEARLDESPEAVRAVLKAVVASGAGNLFSALAGLPGCGPLVLETAAVEAEAKTRGALAERLEERGMVQEAETLRQAGVTDEESWQRKRMLAVDDSEAMRSFYAQFGSFAGYDVQTAENGRVALDMVESGEGFDLVVVDMNMPVMDGIELTTRLRAMPGLASLPILMASTESSKSQARIAKTAGVNSFIVKPFTQEQLREKILKLFGD
ncbi:response regulator [Desulfonatronum thiodismutans]|uniref:response regulator n=1 Tax=Desulfonatronum thiodismutans TaxID=159290 RepID=UPI0004ABD47A|nr:response regulator [Desulfonatronum thiodismutans]